ncbi:DUF1702 family protein [Nonomuraea dietziae]|uniref:DUF1702 family protein n=1 Tax=Nonomuraea dietziae TaxID=65515 RepID=UPI003CD081E8
MRPRPTWAGGASGSEQDRPAPRWSAPSAPNIFGYNAVLSHETGKIDDLPAEQRGFAYEGAATACATLDLLTMSRADGRTSCWRGLGRTPSARRAPRHRPAPTPAAPATALGVRRLPSAAAVAGGRRVSASSARSHPRRPHGGRAGPCPTC